MRPNQSVRSIMNLKNQRASTNLKLSLVVNRLMKETSCTVEEIRDFQALTTNTSTIAFLNRMLASTSEKHVLAYLKSISGKKIKQKSILKPSIIKESTSFKDKSLLLFKLISQFREQLVADSSNASIYIDEIRILESKLHIFDSIRLENNLLNKYAHNNSTFILEEPIFESTPDIDKSIFLKEGGTAYTAILSRNPELELADFIKVNRNLLSFSILYNERKISNVTNEKINFFDKLAICDFTAASFHEKRGKVKNLISQNRILCQIARLEENEKEPSFTSRYLEIKEGKCFYRVQMSRLSYLLLKSYVHDSSTTDFDFYLQRLEKLNASSCYEEFYHYINKMHLQAEFNSRYIIEYQSKSHAINEFQKEESILLGTALNGTKESLIADTIFAYKSKQINLEEVSEKLDYIDSLDKRAQYFSSLRNYYKIDYHSNYYLYNIRTNVPLRILDLLSIHYNLVSLKGYQKPSFSEVNLHSKLNSNALGFNAIERNKWLNGSFTIDYLLQRIYNCKSRMNDYINRCKSLKIEVNEELVDYYKHIANRRIRKYQVPLKQLKSSIPAPSEFSKYKGDINNLVRTWNKQISQLNCAPFYSFKTEKQFNKISVDSNGNSLYGKRNEELKHIPADMREKCRLYASGKNSLGKGALTKYALYIHAKHELLTQFEEKGYFSNKNDSKLFKLYLKAAHSIFSVNLSDLAKMGLIDYSYSLFRFSKLTKTQQEKIDKILEALAFDNRVMIQTVNWKKFNRQDIEYNYTVALDKEFQKAFTFIFKNNPYLRAKKSDLKRRFSALQSTNDLLRGVKGFKYVSHFDEKSETFVCVPFYMKKFLFSKQYRLWHIENMLS